jgi:hypothetical protein
VTRNARPARSARSSTTACWGGLTEAGTFPHVVHPSAEVADEQFANATIRTPVVVRLDASDDKVYTREWFGPVSFLIATDSTGASLEIFVETVRAHGALTASVYSASPDVLDAAREAALDAGVHLSEKPDRRRLRQPDGGVQRPARHRRQPGRHRLADRRPLRHRPVLRAAVPPPRPGLGGHECLRPTRSAASAPLR